MLPLFAIEFSEDMSQRLPFIFILPPFLQAILVWLTEKTIIDYQGEKNEFKGKRIFKEYFLVSLIILIIYFLSPICFINLNPDNIFLSLYFILSPFIVSGILTRINKDYIPNLAFVFIIFYFFLLIFIVFIYIFIQLVLK